MRLRDSQTRGTQGGEGEMSEMPSMRVSMHFKSEDAPDMDKITKEIKAELQPTLLGVPTDLLLKAMEIVPVPEYVYLREPAKLLNDGGEWWFKNRFGRHNVYEKDAECRIKDAIRERLEWEGCTVESTVTETIVSEIDHQAELAELAINPHYLTALCMAVCEIGGRG